MYSNTNALRTKQDNLFLSLSFLQAAMILTAVILSMLQPSVYKLESRNWQIQAIGQDLIDGILVVPALVICTVCVLRNKAKAFYIWGGFHLYLLYTFIIYAFSVHFNSLFLLYCGILGISVYSLLWYFSRLLLLNSPILFRPTFSSKIIAVYFIMVGCLFILLWLFEIVPAIIAGGRPGSLDKTALFTNPVHVLDISVVLPSFIIVAVLLLQGRRIAFLLVSSLLTFMLLMSITIMFLTVFTGYQEQQHNAALASNIALFSLICFFLLRRHLGELVKATPAHSE
ncbi:MAG TPA: hypothetical protein VL121_08880 [Agriterribacter sp.]|nr:hypothetical protein [Agriterribacter sp.]HTN06838.1 hypothetical protein [Agriterribacter sp.]